jgi:hypothetical protein
MEICWTTAMLDLPSAVLDPALTFWRQITDSGLSPWRGEEDEYATLLAPDGDDFLRVQRFEAGPRVHLDLHVGDAAAVRSGLVQALALGAALEHEASHHVVLSSPGGYVFCLVNEAGHGRRPSPVVVEGPASALVDQLCLDVPAGLFDDEVAFWASLTGRAARTGSRSEFVVLDRQAGMPLRIMLQRLGEDPRRSVTAHLDLATTGRPAVERAHVAAGARVVGTGPRWTVLVDPAGSPYCLTDRSPETGALPS